MAKRPLAWSTEHVMFRPLFLALGEICERNPGTVLADPFDGHYITFYTDCSVKANNFLISPLHLEKARRVNYLFSLPVDKLIEEAVEADYIFASLYARDLVLDGFENADGRATLLDANQQDYPGMSLLLEPQQNILVGGKPVKVGRLFKLDTRQ